MGINLTEPAIVQDTYVSGLADIEDLGEGVYRFTFYATQKSIYDGVGHDHVVVSRLILNGTSVIKGMQQTMEALGFACCGGQKIKYLAH